VKLLDDLVAQARANGLRVSVTSPGGAKEAFDCWDAFAYPDGCYLIANWVDSCNSHSRIHNWRGQLTEQGGVVFLATADGTHVEIATLLHGYGGNQDEVERARREHELRLKQEGESGRWRDDLLDYVRKQA
jgi:hypothetical protein